ncbi:hypothetical protein PN36_06185 [Candidatus Thiomargarita nelsonii]|uniref:Uncharacterized protein n=1 Tax=Candidatus Thiomargarita nelsonii TaxID=1003181 RepID=A0A0A6PL25_9GAMM|nr:hypothetical protein PN36_06185 [Candidatus Thiomargarita nelsonii]
MFAHRVEVTIPKNGHLYLEALPFAMGEKVEVIILKQPASVFNEKTVSFAQAAKKFQGCIKKAPVDLSVNSDYLEGFGE